MFAQENKQRKRKNRQTCKQTDKRSKIEEYFRFKEIEREDTLPTCKWSLYLRGQIQIEKKRKRTKICVCLESS
jgi:hypothetical protein